MDGLFELTPPPPAALNLPPCLGVVLVDDHHLVREGLTAALRRLLPQASIRAACGGASGVELWNHVRPDVAFIDLRMPEVDGLECMRRIRQVDSGAKLVALTTMSGDEDVYRSLHAGALGFLLKDFEPSELVACLGRVLLGQRYIQVEAANRLADRVTASELTEREREVLTLVASGYSNKHIGRALAISEGTVKTHVKGILSKLGVASRTQAIGLAHRRGLVRL